MKQRITLSKLIRRTHMFLGLFLTPWILMYALSTIAMHHRVLFTGEQNRVDPAFDVVREESYTHTLDSQNRDDVARQILQDLDLEGAFTVRGDLDEGTLTIFRSQPVRAYRITYEANEGNLRVERQRFGMSYFLEMMHRRRGYQQDYVANDIWAVIVDGVIFTIIIWAITGLWMWWEMFRTRRFGALCLGAGIVFFLIFLLTL